MCDGCWAGWSGGKGQITDGGCVRSMLTFTLGSSAAAWIHCCEFGRPHALPQTGNMLPCSRPCNNNLCCCPHTDPSHCQATTLYICSVGLVAASPHTYHPTTFQSPPLQRLLYFPAAAFPAAALSLKLAIRGALGLGAYSSAFALSRTVSNFLFARRATLAGRCCAAYASPCHPPCPASER